MMSALSLISLAFCISIAGMEFKGPLWHPFRAMYNLTTWGMFLTVPVFYLAIFKFRRGQESTAGINENLFHASSLLQNTK